MAEVEIAGAKIKGGKIMLILPLLGTLGGGLWGGFEFYKDYMDMKEIIQNIDISSIQSENTLVQTKLDKAIDYTRDIKDDLREDILKLEGYIDKMDSKVEKSIDSVRETKLLIDATLENMLTANNELQKDTTASLREVESLNRETEKDVRNTLRETEERIDSNMRKLEDKLTERLQEALDNPLSD
jgi:FtsZ-binding cell division protein ZapB|tara:strand:+ start:1463 stop:2017 length:555 start_codon:yes stop_codon:yes gene_type:complete